MKNILNFFLTFLVLLAGWRLFPEVFWFSGMEAVLVTTIILFGLGTAVVLLIILPLAFLGARSDSEAGSIFLIASGVILALVFSVMEIKIVDALYGGFSFNGGILEQCLIAVAMSFFQFKTSKDNS